MITRVFGTFRTGDFPDSNNCPDWAVPGTGKAKVFYHRETWRGEAVGVERMAWGPDGFGRNEESSPPLPSPVGKTVWWEGPGAAAFRNIAPPTFWPVLSARCGPGSFPHLLYSALDRKFIGRFRWIPACAGITGSSPFSLSISSLLQVFHRKPQQPLTAPD